MRVVLVYELAQGVFSFDHSPVVLEVDLVVLESPPKALRNDIVQSPTFAVHAKRCPRVQENLGEVRASEGGTLVGIEDFRRPVDPKSLFHGLDAKEPVTGIGQPPAQNGTSTPVQDRHQVGPPPAQPDVGDIGTPDLVWTVDDKPSQQIGIDLVFLVALREVSGRIDHLNPQDSHQTLDPLAVDDFTLQRQPIPDQPAPPGGVVDVDLIDSPHKPQVEFRLLAGKVVVARSRKREQSALVLDA